ncbi:SDR family oxidoreductase [Patescibacteria group bacterium]|nr:SDR family oxidoreductase [Patescibacteria group bacterium]MBU1931445.1 SDR family oxidoreductase [Patescibacteria group bacterium]
MKIPLLGTGLSGLVGSRLVELFSHKYSFELLDLDRGIDITNRRQVFDLIGKSSSKSLIHMAAFTNVSRAHQETDNKKGLVYQVNVLGTRNIVQACRQFNKYLIHISTDFVFNGRKKSPYTEKDPRLPIEWYGQTKAWAEEEVEKLGSNYAIFRLAFPFRAKFAAKPDLVKKVIAQLKNNTLPPQWDDVLVTPTFIDDIAQALDLALAKKPQGIFHCVGSTSLSAFQLATQVAAVFGLDQSRIKKGSYKEYLKTDPRPRQQYLAVNNKKLEKELGFKFHTFREALAIIKQ